MKRHSTTIMAEKSTEPNAEMSSLNPGQGRKVIYTPKPHDYSHGRINKHAIGVNHEPGLFR